MRVLLLAAVLVSVIAAPALANDPSMESCVKYAEADSAFKIATEEARTRAYNARNEHATRIWDKEQKADADLRAAHHRERHIKREASAPILEKHEPAKIALKREKRRAIALLPRGEQLYGDKRGQLNMHFDAKHRKLINDTNSALDALDDIYNAAVKEAQDAHAAIKQELYEEKTRLNKEIDDAYEIAVAEPEAELSRIYEEAYEGPVSDNPKIMDKLRLRHRKRCKTLYDM